MKGRDLPIFDSVRTLSLSEGKKNIIRDHRTESAGGLVVLV